MGCLWAGVLVQRGYCTSSCSEWCWTEVAYGMLETGTVCAGWRGYDSDPSEKTGCLG